MQNKPRLVLACFILVIAGIVAGLVIENKTHLWHNANHRPNPEARTDSSEENWAPYFKLVKIKSPVDGEMQKAYYYRSTATTPQPLVINLHSWSWDYRQFDSLAILSREKNINFIHPDFRGQNWTPDACCSNLVITDIDAAIDYAIAQGNVDTSEIYVTGRSGGGYATIASFMKLKHKVKKFSSWVPLTDLIAWYEETNMRKLNYAKNILVCTHSENGQLNKEIAIQKSPYYWPTPAEKLANTRLDIFDGVYDGLENNGPIPITHSINFYNKVLVDLKVADSSRYISNAEKLQLLEHRKPLGNFGQIGGRDICLQKSYGNIRITIFTGGHEMLQDYAFAELFK